MLFYLRDEKQRFSLEVDCIFTARCIYSDFYYYYDSASLHFGVMHRGTGKYYTVALRLVRSCTHSILCSIVWFEHS